MASPAKSSTLSPRKSGSPGLSVRVSRERSSSIVKVEKLGDESQADVLDQSVYDNLNAEWVNRKGASSLSGLARTRLTRTLDRSPGAWLIHPVLIFAGKVVIDTIPGMRQEISWTLVNLLYLGVSATVCPRPTLRLNRQPAAVPISHVSLRHWDPLSL